MITKDTPIGTRVFRNFDGAIGTVVQILEYRPDDGDDVGSVSVCLDRDLTIWSGTFEAWDLADGNLDRPNGDEVFTLIREALEAKHGAGYEQARYIHKYAEDEGTARRPETLAQWRTDARVGLHDDSADYVEVSRRVLALLDALDETERNWQLDADRMREAREALGRIRLDAAQRRADDLVVRMWRSLYDWASA